MEKSVIAYARQSLKQPDRESSTVGQHKAIQEYCEKKNVTVHQSFSDVASGKNMNRKNIQKIIEMIKQGLVSNVIVWRIDRISRNIRHLLDFFTLCEEKNVQIESVNDETLGYKNSMDKFKVQVLASIAELQRNIISENKMIANESKFKKGHTLNHLAPFGYKYMNGKFKIVPKEAKTVKVVFDLYLKGYGYKKIAQLTGERLELIDRKPYEVKNILMNPKYKGDYVGKYGIIKNTIPPIISRGIFEKAHEIRLSKQQKRTYTVKAALRKKLECPVCGNTMTPYHYRKQINSTPVYMCQLKMRGQYNDCSMRSIPISKIEFEVLQSVRKFLSSPEELKTVHSLVVNRIKDSTKKQKQHDLNIQKQKARLITHLADGKIDPQTFKEELSQFQPVPTDEIHKLNIHEVTLNKISHLIKSHDEVSQALWLLIKKVEISSKGQLKGVYLEGLDMNIINNTLKENIENDITSKQ